MRVSQVTTAIMGRLAEAGVDATASSVTMQDRYSTDVIHPEGGLIKAGGRDFLVVAFKEGLVFPKKDQELFIRALNAATERHQSRASFTTVLPILDRMGGENDLFAHRLEQNPHVAIKHVLPSDASLAQRLDAAPSLGPLWRPHLPQQPSWVTGMQLTSDNLPHPVEAWLPAGPALLVVQGANYAQEMSLLPHLSRAVRGEASGVDLHWEGASPSTAAPAGAVVRFDPHKLPEASPASEMGKFRRLLGYGDPDGVLRMPLQFESQSFQRLEMMGQALLERVAPASGTSADGWPGIILDAPLTGLDEMRNVRASMMLVHLAQHFQVILTVHEGQHASFLRHYAAFAGVAAGTLKLQQAVLEAHHGPSTLLLPGADRFRESPAALKL